MSVYVVRHLLLTDFTVSYWEGCRHGFAVRGDLVRIPLRTAYLDITLIVVRIVRSEGQSRVRRVV